MKRLQLCGALAIAFLLGGCWERTPRQTDEGIGGSTTAAGVPGIGARVRVIVPQLGPGWRVGMFNRTRVEPPCYVVLLFDPGPVRRIAATVPIGAVARLQVSALYPGTDRVDPDPGAASHDGERWLEAPLEVAQSISRHCDAAVDTTR